MATFKYLNKSLEITHHTYTVLAVSNCVGHDGTSYAVLKRVEVEFCCGMCRCNTGTQCWVHGVNFKAAHLVLECSKGSHLEGGGMPNRREIWLFQGVNMDEIGWNFHGGIQTPWPTVSTRIHSPGPPVLWASMQKPGVRVERLLGSVKQQKESDGVTTWQVNKTHRRQSGNLKAVQIVPSSSEREKAVRVAVIRTSERRQSGDLKTRWPSSAGAGEGSLDGHHRQEWEMAVGTPELCRPNQTHQKREKAVQILAVHIEISRLSSMSVLSMSKCHPVVTLHAKTLRFLLCLLIAPEGLKNESPWKMSAFGSGFLYKDFSLFHPLLPLEKAKFQSSLACPPLHVSSFWAF